jgi:two-component system CheB/CheR fusion protein
MTNKKQKTQVAEDEPVVLSGGVKNFPIVGIGASAGGLAAFEAFFSTGTLAGSTMAFVLVQHLAPDHTSILTELVQRYTCMKVFEVEDGMVVEPGCVYIIPPNRDMALINGTLQLLDPDAPRGQRLPIDFFFRSLAQDQHERAIGIVLSGTGSDGTVGVRSIKSEGGMVMVQTPETTEFDGMPRSVIATGLADYMLPPAEMAAKLIAYVAHTVGKPTHPDTVSAPKTETAMKKIFVLLRAQTGHDFSNYKPSTISRRIERRMAVNQIESIDDYVRHLQRNPAEVGALFNGLLIGVTNFFRDPEAFQLLVDKVIPKIFADKHADDVVRVWTTGCSTGEEAYSLAILLVERMEALKQSFNVQIFATDIDCRAIATARAGRYPASIAADISPERLARFFTIEPDGSAYRVHKGIRDMLIFSEQNLIKDTPFSKLDLISCRNLLIYLDAELQKKLIPLFHYALKPGGMLFLGTSEGIGEFDTLFSVVDRKAKLYQRHDDIPGRRATRPLVFPLVSATQATRMLRSEAKIAFPLKLPLRELTEQSLLQQVIAAGVLVNGHGDILYLHGRTGMFLEPAPGEAGINNILKMAREGLRLDLTATLHKATGTRDTVHCPGVRVKTNGHFTTVNLTVRPVTTGAGASPESPLYLVILEEAPGEGTRPTEDIDDVLVGRVPSHGGKSVDARIAALTQELRAKEEYLQSSNEELESSAEELKSSNEEMQSVNEELQSTNEELETAKEELQSVNEELSTVNTELQIKVMDLSRANNDMNNLLAGTGVGTIFVDHQLRIMRFTPAAASIINLIPGDIGRPIAHFVSNLVGYNSLVADVKAVLDTLVSKEADVQVAEGKWYAMRIQPYRTLDNVIEGAVITFAEITEIVQARETRAVWR